MSNTLAFSGSVTVSSEPGRPLPLVLSGELRDEAGVRAMVSFDVAANPNLPADLRDIVLEYATGSAPQTCRVLAAARTYSFEARRVFVHRDLRVPMCVVVPPQPVSAAYRWRWRLGVWVARIPLLRSWLS